MNISFAKMTVVSLEKSETNLGHVERTALNLIYE